MAQETAHLHKKSEKTGQVVSTKMEKTIIVEVTRRVSHPLYRRVVTKKKRFYAHDAESSAKLGDIVKIIESRPISRLKRWRLGEVLRRAAQIEVQPKGPESGSETENGI